MSAAHWRKAMNAPTGNGAGSGRPPATGTPGPATLRPGAAGSTPGAAREPSVLATLRWRHLLVLAALLAYPWFATPFFTFQIGAQSLVLGIIALSLTFLAGYGGMVSLAQMTIAGVAGYTVAILGVNGTPEITVDWPWWAIVPIALFFAVLASTLVGWLSVRTEGIYTIMITLAIGVAFY
jgi:branched-chain amino acid transport system permease protein